MDSKRARHNQSDAAHERGGAAAEQDDDELDAPIARDATEAGGASGVSVRLLALNHSEAPDDSGDHLHAVVARLPTVEVLPGDSVEVLHYKAAEAFGFGSNGFLSVHPMAFNPNGELVDLVDRTDIVACNPNGELDISHTLKNGDLLVYFVRVPAADAPEEVWERFLGDAYRGPESASIWAASLGCSLKLKTTGRHRSGQRPSGPPGVL